MESLRGKFRVILVIIGVALFVHAEGWGADWKWYGETEADLGSLYYDAESITYPSKNTVRVWEKMVYTEKGIDFMVTTMGKGKFETLSYSLTLREVNCADKKTRMLHSVAYSKDGEVLVSGEYQNSNLGNWRFIVPESVSEGLHKILCK